MEPDLVDLMSAWLGGETNSERCEALLARLRRDEEFRRAFVAEIRMLGMLKTVQSPESRWLRLEDELGWSAAEPASSKTLEDRIVGHLGEAPRLRLSRRLGWVFASAAALLVSISLAWYLWQPKPRDLPPITARPYPKVDTANGLAMVIKLNNIEWEPTEDPRPSVGDVLGAGRFRIRAGRAVLSMLTGVLLDVEGPADFELLSSDKVHCHLGRIRARVPAGAEGFLVLGPSSAVVDLGTEFGLNVGADGKMRGQVFKGQLEAALLSPTGTPQRSYSLNAARANATKAFEIDSRAGRIDAVATSADYISVADPVASPLNLDPEYPAAIMRSRPWGYWRFEALADGLIRNEIQGRPSLRASGPILLTDGSGGNRSAEFRPDQGRQYLAMSELWHPTWAPGYAVEFWCMPESICHASLVGMIAPVETDHHVFLMELTSRNRLTIHKPASVRLLHRWPPGWEGGDNAYSHDPYVPYRWHHIVGQINGDRIELYTDGKPTTSLSIAPKHSDIPCQFILGRLTTLPGSGLSVDRPFIGRMDEVALYDRPLTEDEIQNHYRLGMKSANEAK